MLRDSLVPLIDMVFSLSHATDLVSPAVANHHKRVGYIAARLGEEMGISPSEQSDLLIAGCLHDIGALSLQERLGALEFELEPGQLHAITGASLLEAFKPFQRLSSLVRHHHAHFATSGEEVPPHSHLLHLADRVDVVLRPGVEVLSQVPAISEKIEIERGHRFAPWALDAFQSLSTREAFWLDLVSPTLDRALRKRARMVAVELDLSGLNSLAQLFSQIIDFRSSFTATHSCGVAAVGEQLGKSLGMSPRECALLKVSGYLHDLGKLAVPAEVLEKPGRLTKDEYNLIRSHTFHTYRILEMVTGLETVATWAALHHESLDGSGYPFHYHDADIPLGARIIAVSDVFTALTEDRPYRVGMQPPQVTKILNGMVKHHKLDQVMVNLLLANQELFNSVRMQAQAEARERYDKFWRRLQSGETAAHLSGAGG